MNKRKIVMVRKGLKAIGLIFLFGISLGSVYLVNLFFMKPASIDHYLNRILQKVKHSEAAGSRAPRNHFLNKIL